MFYNLVQQFWPCGWGIAMIAPSDSLPDPHMFGMRSAGCTTNDMWNRNIGGRFITWLSSKKTLLQHLEKKPLTMTVKAWESPPRRQGKPIE
uniref:Uncharacterized protein n=1 Tax=Timema genevievae TaxID=629358 RepID=A0A7R9JVT3_TIMGE|nr:unnamed protein product [Timema genevievae]